MRRGWEWTLRGAWLTANGALDAARRDGYAHGRLNLSRELNLVTGRRVLYENLARAARETRQGVVDLVCHTAPAFPLGPDPEVWLVVHAVYPDERVDPDAAAIVSKWILDGLKDSGIITSERQVIGTMHRTTYGPVPQIYFSLQYPEEIIV